MQAFIKDNKLIVLPFIQNCEEPKLDEFIKSVMKYGAIPEVIYNTSGEAYGIAFKTKKGE